METRNEAIGQTVTHVLNILKHLNHGEELTEQECTQVIDDLTNLRIFKNTDTTGGQSDMDIDEMLIVFNTSANDSKVLLQNMLGIVAAGKVPSESDMRKLDKSVADLREKYYAICSVAMDEVSADEMPEEGASAAEYIEAVKNCAASVYRRKLDEIKTVLKQFISVQSLVSPGENIFKASKKSPACRRSCCLSAQKQVGKTPCRPLQTHQCDDKVDDRSRHKTKSEISGIAFYSLPDRDCIGHKGKSSCRRQ